MSASTVFRSLGVVAALTLGTALAHTEVTAVSPAAYTSGAAPTQVTLTFSEPINLRFCTFKVYPLTARGSAAELRRAAQKLAQTALPAKDDEALRADLPVVRTELVAKVSLALKPKVKAGHYVVMWRLLSDDGHPVTGQSVFQVK